MHPEANQIFSEVKHHIEVKVDMDELDIVNAALGANRARRFPKKKDTAYGYEEVLGKHDNAVIDNYDLVETDTELYITEQVNNILFEKN